MTSHHLAAAFVDKTSARPDRAEDPIGPTPPNHLRPVPSNADDAGPVDVRSTPRSLSGRSLPDPEPMCRHLARSIVEILAGVRDLDQIARWVTDDVYRHVAKRVSLARRARSAHGRSAVRPALASGPVRLCQPADGVVEAVVVLHSRGRSRAVALRLEGIEGRWRASAVHVL